MPSRIAFVDGNTNTVVTELPAEEVPPANREVYLRGGQIVASREEADEVVAIARVVRWLVDDAGKPVAPERATGAVIQEFDAAGVLRRETLQRQAR